MAGGTGGKPERRLLPALLSVADAHNAKASAKAVSVLVVTAPCHRAPLRLLASGCAMASVRASLRRLSAERKAVV